MLNGSGPWTNLAPLPCGPRTVNQYSSLFILLGSKTRLASLVFVPFGPITVVLGSCLYIGYCDPSSPRTEMQFGPRTKIAITYALPD